MLRQSHDRIDPKRRNVVDYRKKQFGTPQYKDTNYPYRLNFYADAPTADITLEQFEQWAIDRLRGKSKNPWGIPSLTGLQCWANSKPAPFATDHQPKPRAT